MSKFVQTILKNKQLRSVLAKTKAANVAIPKVEDPTLQTWIKAIDANLKEAVRKAVTKSDLIDLGLAGMNNGNLEGLIPKPDDVDLTVPAAVVNLRASGAYSSITLDWETPKNKNFGYNAVYRSEIDDFGTALQVGSTLGDVYTDYIGNNAKVYYWVRTVSKYNVEGNLAPSVYAETSVDIPYLLSQLTGQIAASQLDQYLSEKIDSIYTEVQAITEIESRLVEERLQTNRDILAETESRAQAIEAEANTLRQEIYNSALASSQELYQASQDLLLQINNNADAALEQANNLNLSIQTEAQTRQQALLDEAEQRTLDIAAEAEARQREILAEADARTLAINNAVEIIEGEQQTIINRVDGIFAQVNPDMAGATDGFAGSTEMLVGAWSETSARIEGDLVNAQRMDIMQAQINGNDLNVRALIATEQEARATSDEAFARQFTTISATINKNDTDVKALITQESLARADEGEALTKRIDTLKAGYDENLAAITLEQKAHADGLAAVADQIETMQTDIGDNNALILNESKVRSDQFTSLAREMTFLSAGVGEQFDTYFISFFDEDLEGWTSEAGTPIVLEGYIRPPDHAATNYLVSPLFETPIKGSTYPHVRARLKKVGAPVWSASILYGPDFSLSCEINEPTWIGDFATIQLDIGWTGDVSQVKVKFADIEDADNHYFVDWFAIGRPSPSASYSALYEEQFVRAEEDRALSQSINNLTLFVNTENGRVEGLIRQETDTRVEQDEALHTRIDNVVLDYGNKDTQVRLLIQNETDARVNEDGALHTKIDNIVLEFDGKDADVRALLQNETDTRVEEDGALHTRIDNVVLEFDGKDADVRAIIQKETDTRVEETGALHTKIDNVVLEFDGKDAEVRALIQDETDARALENGAIVEKVDGIFAQVNPQMAGATESLAGDSGKLVGVWSEASARIEGDMMQASYTRQLFAEAGEKIEASITQVQNVISDLDTSYAMQFDGISAKLVGVPEGSNFQTVLDSNIQQLKEAIVDANGFLATSTLFEGLSSSLGDYVDSEIGELKRTYADNEFTLSTTYENLTSSTSNAQAAADKAQKAAEDAQDAADTANEQLSDISSDGKLTPTEKKQLKVLVEEIKQGYNELATQATEYDVSFNAYDVAYNALSAYIAPLLNKPTVTDTINRTEFNNGFINLYAARSALLTAIANKAKTLTGNAQSAADKAQGAAEDAQGAADNANLLLQDIAADEKLTSAEKKQVKVLFEEIKQGHNQLSTQATLYGVSFAAYQAAYNALNAYITPLLVDLAATETINRANFNNHFSTLYAARSNLLKAIAEKAKELSDKAQAAAGEAKASFDEYNQTYTDQFLGAVESVQKIEATYIPNMAGATDSLAGTSEVQAGAFSVWSAIAEGDLAVSQRTDQLRAEFEAANAVFQNQQLLVAEELRAIGVNTTTIQASIDQINKDSATFREDMVAFVDEEFGAASGQITNLEKVVDGQKTSLEIVSAVGDVELIKHQIAKSRLDKNIADLQLQKVSINAKIADINLQIAILEAKKNEKDANLEEIQAQIDRLNAAKADVQATLDAIDPQIQQIQDEKAELDELLETQAKIKAQHTIKLDSDGVVSSIGLAIEEDESGEDRGVIAFRAHRLYVVPPDTDLTKGVVPFIIDNNKVIIDVALIKDGSITNAKIGSLAADKITTGDIAADRMKTNIVKAVEGQFKTLSSITGTIGHLRTATSGARTEIRDNLIEVYDSSGRVRVRLGVW